MASRVRFSEQVVMRANAQLIQQRGRPTSLPRELLGIVTYKPRTVQEIKSAFACIRKNATGLMTMAKEGYNYIYKELVADERDILGKLLARSITYK